MNSSNLYIMLKCLINEMTNKIIIRHFQWVNSYKSCKVHPFFAQNNIFCFDSSEFISKHQQRKKQRFSQTKILFLSTQFTMTRHKAKIFVEIESWRWEKLIIFISWFNWFWVKSEKDCTKKLIYFRNASLNLYNKFVTDSIKKKNMKCEIYP